MYLQRAISLRICELVEEKHITFNQLAERSGLCASSISRTVTPYEHIHNTSTATILKICLGLGISFKEFWDSPLFDDLDILDD